MRVQERCYEDGIATTNVDQILLVNTNVGYVHFVYANARFARRPSRALEAYRSRPKHFAELKTRATTFGPGLSEEQIKKRLTATVRRHRLVSHQSALMQTWVSRADRVNCRQTDAEKSHSSRMLENDAGPFERNRKRAPESLTTAHPKKHIIDVSTFAEDAAE